MDNELCTGPFIDARDCPAHKPILEHGFLCGGECQHSLDRLKELEQLRTEWSIMARACGNWREFNETREKDHLHPDWQVAARAILERDNLRQALSDTQDALTKERIRSSVLEPSARNYNTQRLRADAAEARLAEVRRRADEMVSANIRWDQESWGRQILAVLNVTTQDVGQ